MKRIRTELEGGAWCPAKPIGPKSYEFLQIDLGQLFFISSIETQGRFDNGQGNEYAEYYRIQYQRENNQSNWLNYYNKKSNKSVSFTTIDHSKRIDFPGLFCFSIDYQRECQYVYGRETLSRTTHRSSTHSYCSFQFTMANDLYAS